MGKMLSVRYGLTKNIGNYESLRLDAEKEVSEGEDPAEVLVELRAWITEQIGSQDNLARLKKEARELSQEIQQLKWNKSHALEILRTAKKKWEEAKKILETFGITEIDDFPVFEDKVKESSAEDASEYF